MFWFVMLYHIVIIAVLLQFFKSKTGIPIGLVFALLLPSAISVVRNIGFTIRFFSTVSNYGFLSVGWGIANLYIIPVILVGIGFVLWIIETLIPNFPVPCIDTSWLKLSGLRLVNAGFGINAGIWIAARFIS